MTRSGKRLGRRAAALAVFGIAAYLLLGIEAASRPFDADDLRHDWTAGKALARGQDFYDGGTLQRIWAEDPEPGAVPGRPAYPYFNAPHYTFFVAPFSALPFGTAKVAFAVVSLIFYAVAIAVLATTVARAWPRWQRIAALGAAAGFAPVWFAVASGQASLVVFALLVAGCAALMTRREAAGGVLIGLAAFKYTMGMLVFPYLALRRRWKALAVSVGVAGGLSVLALARAGFGSIGSYLDALRVSAGNGGVNSAFGPNAGSDLSLLPLIARIVTPAHQRLAYVLYGCTLALIGYVLSRTLGRTHAVTWLEFAIVLLVCQLAVYHRAYDAVVVVLAGAAALASERVRRAPFALAVTLGSLFVVANAHAPLARGSGRFAWLWDVAVLSHRTWAVIGLLAVLCWAAAAERKRPDPAEAKRLQPAAA